MAKTTKVSQKKWIKGVNAAAQSFAQPPGSFPRASNLIYIRRGSLVTCDGSSLISAFDSAVQALSANLGPITDIFLYSPIGGLNSYFALAKDYNTHLGAPAGLGVAAGATGVLNGTYKWVVTALDGAGGETTVSSEVTQTLTSQKGAVTWTALANAISYNIYRTVVGGGAGTEKLSGNSLTNSYTDNVADTSLSTQVPPSADTTQVVQFYAVPITSYSAADIVFTFPADTIEQFDGTGGGYGGGGGGAGTGGGGAGAGGAAGNMSPIPQILQFKNLMVLILGNGLTPYTSDGTTGNTAKITNGFQASYGSRVASTPQNVGDQISATVSSIAYIFTAVQAGTTSSGALGSVPFAAGEGSIAVDGTVYWKNTGRIAVVTAPRGAAHGIVYAGSLWVANTYPTSTTDNFDGPSCLKMSDLNNPNSWNPLNVAFLDRDDGTQITGLATFTIAESGIPPVGSLVAFKDFSTFQINGVFGASNFSIQRAQTDMGCMASRTIQFVPGFGIVRLTHLGFAMFDGVRDRLLSEELRPYLFGGQSDIPAIDWNYAYFSKATQVAQPPMYVCACPILRTIAGTLDTVVISRPTTPAACTIPPGTYYTYLIMQTGSGQLYKSSEFTVVVDATHGFRVTLNFPIHGSNSYRFFLWYGLTPSGENTVISSPPSFFGFGGAHTFNAPGVAGQPNSSGGALTRLFCYDLVLKSWAIVDLPYPISALRQFRVSGSIPITVAGGFYDGGIRRWLGGAGLDPTWDAGAVNAGAPDAIVRWTVRTPEVFGKDASDRVYFRQLVIRGVGSPIGIGASITVNGVSGATLLTRNLTVAPMGGGEFAAYADIGATGVDAHAILSGSGPVEIQSVDWVCVPKAVRGRVAVG